MSSKTYEHWWQVERIFSEALELDPQARAEFLDKACRGDPELRQEVQSLLDANQNMGGFLENRTSWLNITRLPDHLTARENDPLGSLEGMQIGAYKLLEQIGSGGMSSVYLAERIDGQFRQRVAFKLLRYEMEGSDKERRLRLERQILAWLRHPNMPFLLDGGLTENGVPFLVMEYIDGEPIDRYCDRKRLFIEKRLELFLEVCEVVQYAHQNLVVHRDLKPSNILVTPEGWVKLLDFGIAKLLDFQKHGFGTTLYTLPGQRLMTPNYASPEQFRGDTITIASDVYSLGVLLCKLLSGHLPYNLDNRSILELEQIVNYQEPVAPSRLVTENYELQHSDGTIEQVVPEKVSAARSTRPDILRRRLKGDLDAIVLKTLNKSPKLRYASVTLLAEDIRRHLQGFPVTARQNTMVYRARKFIGRHRWGVLMSIVFLALIIMCVTM